MSLVQESVEAERAELERVLQSETFVRAPSLSHLLSYLCEKSFAGEVQQIKEYAIAVDVFGRSTSFDQDCDSIVRVQANRLRRRLAEYYAAEGANHLIHISIPVGQYTPRFEARESESGEEAAGDKRILAEGSPDPLVVRPPAAKPRLWVALLATAVGAALLIVLALLLPRAKKTGAAYLERPSPIASETPVGLPVGDETRILAGNSHNYVDRAGKVWSADRYFSGGMMVRSPVRHIWRTLDPEIYRASRQGEFGYDIPLKPGNYEMRLHFAETYYGPEDAGGGEGSRVMAVSVNGKTLLSDFDVTADAGGSRVADEKVFVDVSPGGDGLLHLRVTSLHGGRGMLSGIEIVPGLQGRIRPLRIVMRESAYYSDDSQWWSPDKYFRGGQWAVRGGPVEGADDPELYEGERWGNFSYAIPVPPGRYTAILHYVERRFGAANRDSYVGPPHESSGGPGSRVFTVICNGRVVLRDLDLLKDNKENQLVTKKVLGLEPNAQGKLLFEFVPVKDYATISAIEILPE
ncbi:MAG TPA: malectin domain-containing carbohydrate-binding protein [Terriglobales bacterium]|nr:malectin domain-containing carbohydrate-binding protein [Terriglobales bacterium]